MIKIDIHQHLWTEPLVQALAERRELPFVRHEQGLTVLFLAGERPYVIELSAETPASRAALVEHDGIDQALLCLSSPLGIESLPREQSLPLIDAYHDGVLSLDGPFGAWGAIALDHPDPDDIDHAIARGCVGVSLPAGALSNVEALSHLHPVLERMELLEAPLLIHPGPGPTSLTATQAPGEVTLGDPLWWPALTRYVAEMHAAWLAFIAAGRLHHPTLRVIFTMLAGLAPLHTERLSSRGGTVANAHEDSLIFYDTSSYGPSAVDTLAELVGPQQLLYGSDRPIVDPHSLGMSDRFDWDSIADGTRRALGETAGVRAR